MEEIIEETEETNKYKILLKLLEDPLVERVIRKKFKAEAIGPNFAIASAAKSLIPFLDSMIVDRCDMELLYEDFPRWAPTTLRQRVYQSLNFICKNLDPDNKYKKLNEEIVVEKNKAGDGLQLKFIANGYAASAINFRFRKVNILTPIAPVQIENTWKEHLVEFVNESKHNEKFSREGLNLSTDDLIWLESFLSGIASEFEFSFDKTQIKIIHAKFGI